MSSLAQIINRIRGLLGFFAWLPPLIARITVGWVFVESGWGKLHHLDKVAAFFTDLGLPAPGFQAHLVAATEFAGGLLLLTGLFTRLASVPLAVIMSVAIATAKKDELHGFSDLIGFSEFLYMVLLVWLIVSGPGLLALDAFAARKLKRLD
ncbi:MAG TPA: DoxX family protein [Fibrobacteria bacterium]|nr:DoxX family protein [Fibrobacteria bacterium]